MVDTPESLLDLSTWPAQPGGPRPPATSGLPPRPVRRDSGRRRLPLGPRGLVAGLLVAGTALLVVPLGSCGSVLSTRGAALQRLPKDTPPALDQQQLAHDTVAVAQAQAALAVATPGPTTVSRSTSGPSTDQVRDAERAVSRDQQTVAAAQHEVNRLEAEQQASSDPASYDGSVAQAQEQLDQAQAALEEAQHSLALVKARRTTTVTARPGATPDTRALVATLAAARQAQSSHLATRQQTVAEWRSRRAAQVQAVTDHNSRVRRCDQGSVVPGAGGLGLLLASVSAEVWRRRRSAA